MASIGDTWKNLAPGARVAAIVIPVVVLGAVAAAALGALGGGGTATTPSPVGQVGPTPTVTSSLPPPPSQGTPSPGPSPTAPAPTVADPLLGTDGRLTMLLLGSDYRPAHPGNRTDAILVFSVDPVSGKAAAFSIPRDTERFPLPGGGVFGGKVNALYQVLQSETGNGGAALEKAIGAAYGIEIDHYAFIGFAGFRRLIAAVGGVDVTLAEPYYDASYWVNSHTHGWGLPRGTSHLDADQALIFARSRKGDSDFGRARRQQQLILAVIDKVRQQGVGRVPGLLAIAADTVRTDLPLDKAALLFDIVSQVDISQVPRVVFGPRTYTVEFTGGWSPDLKVCRAWVKANFPPARPHGTWPAAPPVTPSPAASEGASAAP